jgi:4'-phosphopantetheinyl transferase
MKGRADRFYYSKDRVSFVATRGLLRIVLGLCAWTFRQKLSFSYGHHGKPRLASPREAKAIQFNVSHTHGKALIAVARGRPVGIDLELKRSEVEVE